MIKDILLMAIVILSCWGLTYGAQQLDTKHNRLKLLHEHDLCIEQADKEKHIRDDLLDYQLDNQFLIWDDYNLSYAYIDFLREKAYSACEGVKDGTQTDSSLNK